MHAFPTRGSPTSQTTHEEAATSAAAQSDQNLAVHSLLQLQRTAGNQAVQRLLQRDQRGLQPHELGQGRRVVQRTLTTQPSDLDEVSGRLAWSIKKKDTFAAIRKALSDYNAGLKVDQSAISTTFGPMAFMEWQLEYLGFLDVLCTQFLNEGHKDHARRQKIEGLQQEVANERLALSRKGTEQIYQGNVEASGESATGHKSDPSNKFGFKALSEQGKEEANTSLRDEKVKQARQELRDQYGLTDAEFSAIRIFSVGDFSYINPATANSSSWLASNKHAQPKEKFAKVEDKTVKEEGSLHTAIAMQGLAKLPRYKGEAYRGSRFTPEQFSEKFAVGNKVHFPTLTSSSYSKDIAADFLFGTGTGTPPKEEQTVGCFAIYTDAGVDITRIAFHQDEAEVLIPAGSWFEVKSLEKVEKPEVEFAEKYKAAAEKYKPERLPTECYIVRLARIDDPNGA